MFDLKPAVSELPREKLACVFTKNQLRTFDLEEPPQPDVPTAAAAAHFK
jgi:hypothetical protein